MLRVVKPGQLRTLPNPTAVPCVVCGPAEAGGSPSSVGVLYNSGGIVGYRNNLANAGFQQRRTIKVRLIPKKPPAPTQPSPPGNAETPSVPKRGSLSDIRLPNIGGSTSFNSGVLSKSADTDNVKRTKALEMAKQMDRLREKLAEATVQSQRKRKEPRPGGPLKVSALLKEMPQPKDPSWKQMSEALAKLREKVAEQNLEKQREKERTELANKVALGHLQRPPEKVSQIKHVLSVQRNEEPPKPGKVNVAAVHRALGLFSTEAGDLIHSPDSESDFGPSATASIAAAVFAPAEAEQMFAAIHDQEYFVRRSEYSKLHTPLLPSTPEETHTRLTTQQSRVLRQSRSKVFQKLSLSRSLTDDAEAEQLKADAWRNSVQANFDDMMQGKNDVDPRKKAAVEALFRMDEASSEPWDDLIQKRKVVKQPLEPRAPPTVRNTLMGDDDGQFSANRSGIEYLAQEGKGKDNSAHDTRVESLSARRDKRSQRRIVQMPPGSQLTVRSIQQLTKMSTSKLMRLFAEEWPELEVAEQTQPLDTAVSMEVADLILSDRNIDLMYENTDDTDIKATFWRERRLENVPDHWEPRDPVVCVMGHVDHGKTTLIDTLRRSNRAAREAGKITQSIGAFTVPLTVSDDSDSSKGKGRSKTAQKSPLEAALVGQHATFLDTPGHAAFSVLREKGCAVTDIVVLIVNAVEGVRPQTIEAATLALRAGVPIVVALNKMDQKGFAPQRVKQELLEKAGVQTEDLGGDVMSVNISALTGEGLQDLKEAISLTAEMLELRAARNCRGEAVVIEGQHDSRRGNVLNIIACKGRIKADDWIVCGTDWGRVRSLQDCKNRDVSSIEPGRAAAVTGLRGEGTIGHDVVVVESEDQARRVTEFRRKMAAVNRENSARTLASQASTGIKAGELPRLNKRIDVYLSMAARNEADKKWKRAVARVRKQAKDFVASELKMGRTVSTEDYPDLFPLEEDEEADEETRDQGSVESTTRSALESKSQDPHSLNLIVKADVRGSLEVIDAYLRALPKRHARAVLISSGLGPATVSDLALAKTTNSIIVTFGVKTPSNVVQQAKRDKIEVSDHAVIYTFFDMIRDALSKVMPEMHEVEIKGSAEVMQVFPMKGKMSGTVIAGCYVESGIVAMGMDARVIRGGKEIISSKVIELRHFKDAVDQVESGTECGIRLHAFNEPEQGDVIEIIRRSTQKYEFDDRIARGGSMALASSSDSY